MKALLSFLVSATLVAGGLVSPPLASAASGSYAYTLNNDGEQNGVVVLARNDDGSLTETAGSPVATGGRGLVVPPGGDFDAQGSVRVHGRYLLAVNPGSNSVAVLAIDGEHLTPVAGSPFASGGVTPLSVTAHGDLVYVANQAVPFMNPDVKPNITGFRMGADGGLTPIPGSTVEFPAGQGPAQVEFSPPASRRTGTSTRSR
jgi:6-phosphogluconolactonase